MIDTIKDDEGRVIAYCEWSVTDKNGILDDKGEYVFVRNFWIWKSNPLKLSVIRHFVDTISKKISWAKYVYWRRTKYNKRVKVFTREEINGYRTIPISGALSRQEVTV